MAAPAGAGASWCRLRGPGGRRHRLPAPRPEGSESGGWNVTAGGQAGAAPSPVPGAPVGTPRRPWQGPGKPSAWVMCVCRALQRVTPGFSGGCRPWDAAQAGDGSLPSFPPFLLPSGHPAQARRIEASLGCQPGSAPFEEEAFPESQRESPRGFLMLPRYIAGCGMDPGALRPLSRLPQDATTPRCKAKEGCDPPTPNPHTQWTCPYRRNKWKPSPVSEVAPLRMGSLHLGIGSCHH